MSFDPILWLAYPLAFASGFGLLYVAPRFALPRLSAWLAERERATDERLRDLFETRVSARTVVSGRWAGAPAVGLLVAALTDSLVFGALAGALLFRLPTLALDSLEHRRREELARQTGDLILALTASIRSGMSLEQAIAAGARELPAPMSQELGLIHRRVASGRPLADALDAADRRLGLPGTSLVFRALIVGLERGGRLADLLEELHQSLREISRVEERVKTETSGIRMASRLMAAMPLAIGGMLYLIAPAQVMILFDTLAGNLILALVVVLDWIGFTMIRKLTELEV